METSFPPKVGSLSVTGSPSAGKHLIAVSSTTAIWSRANYSDLILATPGLEGYWRVGEASGTSAADASGKGLTATYHLPTLGVPGLVPGDSDTAMLASALVTPVMPAMSTWTLSYLHAGGAASDFDCVFSQSDDSFDIAQNADGSFKYADAGGWTNTGVAPEATGASFIWTFDGTTLTLYKNGVSAYSAARGRAISAIEHRWGAFAAGWSNIGQGVLDELAVWSRALSPGESAARGTFHV